MYSAHLEIQLALKPELGPCLQTLLEMQRRNPNADPTALADVSRQALQFYRTNEPFQFCDLLTGVYFKGDVPSIGADLLR